MIPVKNIYYMLSYAFQILKQGSYKNLETEDFNNINDLYASILSKGVSQLLKQGLRKEYIENVELLSSLRGKIDISQSIKNISFMRGQLVCEYDDFTADSYMNRIIKATMRSLIKSDIQNSRKNELRKLLLYFDDVTDIDLNTIKWNQKFNKENQNYRMLLSICKLVFNSFLQSTNSGNIRLMDFIDEDRMSKLYEKFILEYFRKEHKSIKAEASQIKWQLDDGVSLMLPIMQTDITLSKGKNILIIDAKYYAKSMQNNFDIYKNKSGNVYQMFTYVKNKEIELKDSPHKLSGLILYAKTDEQVTPNNTYQMSGNQISVKTLDLNCEFNEIAEQLDAIVEEYFG